MGLMDDDSHYAAETAEPEQEARAEPSPDVESAAPADQMPAHELTGTYDHLWEKTVMRRIEDAAVRDEPEESDAGAAPHAAAPDTDARPDAPVTGAQPAPDAPAPADTRLCRPHLLRLVRAGCQASAAASLTRSRGGPVGAACRPPRFRRRVNLPQVPVPASRPSRRSRRVRRRPRRPDHHEERPCRPGRTPGTRAANRYPAPGPWCWPWSATAATPTRPPTPSAPRAVRRCHRTPSRLPGRGWAGCASPPVNWWTLTSHWSSAVSLPCPASRAA